jgi:hypothetical protein
VLLVHASTGSVPTVRTSYMYYIFVNFHSLLIASVNYRY